jgi:hypothetical protein
LDFVWDGKGVCPESHNLIDYVVVVLFEGDEVWWYWCWCWWCSHGYWKWNGCLDSEVASLGRSKWWCVDHGK